MWVACQAECTDDQSDLFLPVTPPVIALCSQSEGEMELSRSDGVGPCEGDAAADDYQEEDEPAVGWLSTMWEGGWDGTPER